VSIRIMTQVWESGPDDRGELLVLLAMADFANDKGECWPSVATIARKARMDERSARRILRKLEANGWLTISIGGGRHGCSRYSINTDIASPGQNVPTGKGDQKPGQNEQETRTPVSPEPSGTVMESSVVARAPEPPCDRDDKSHARARLLGAMGVGQDGIAGPSCILGSSSDMAEAERWTNMGVALQTQCKIIAEVCRRQRINDPSWMPRSFRYFTGAMHDSLKSQAPSFNQNDSKADRINSWRMLAAS